MNLIFFIKREVKRHKKYIVDEVIKEKPDYILIVNPEVTTTHMLNMIKLSVPNTKTVLYLWDSLINKRNAKSLIGLCDLSFSFDRIDANSNDGLQFLPLFYERTFFFSNNEARSFELAFVGSHHSNRSNLFKFKKSGLNFFLHLYVQGPIIKFIKACLTFSFSGYRDFLNYTTTDKISKKQVGEVFRRSRAILDQQHPSQSGLTARTFEALACGCKLITTNKDIVNYDFYDQDLICVTPEIDQIPLEFIKKDPGVDAHERMLKKIESHEISYWIDALFRSI